MNCFVNLEAASCNTNPGLAGYYTDTMLDHATTALEIHSSSEWCSPPKITCSNPSKPPGVTEIKQEGFGQLIGGSRSGFKGLTTCDDRPRFYYYCSLSSYYPLLCKCGISNNIVLLKRLCPCVYLNMYMSTCM